MYLCVLLLLLLFLLSILDAIALYYALITSDNCNTIASQLDGEVWEDYCSTLITGVRLPPKAKDAVAFILRNVVKDVKAATLTKQSRERTVAEVTTKPHTHTHAPFKHTHKLTHATPFDQTQHFVHRQ